MNLKLFFSRYRIVYVILLALILIFGIVIRLDDLAYQFPTEDDVGVAATLILRVNEGYVADYIRNKIYDAAHEDHNTPQYKFLRNLDKQDKLESLLPYLNKTMKFVSIPQTWTYAPFQYLFYPFLISPDQSYRELLFWGRLPSVVFSVLALLLFVYFYSKTNGQNKLLQCVAGLLILVFSWENIIYAKHMSSYAIGVFSVVLLMCVLVKVLDRQKLTIVQGILIGSVLAIIGNMQYQTLFFIPAFFFVWLLKIIEEEKKKMAILVKLKSLFRIDLIKGFLAALVSCTIFILPTIVFFIMPQTERGGPDFTGISKNFYFLIPSDVGFLEGIEYAISFFIQNGFKTIRFITTYLPADNAYFNISALIILGFAVFGAIRLNFSKNDIYKYIGRFFVVSTATVVALVIMHRVALSPTRHFLIYLPFIAFSASYGISEVFNFLKTKIKFISAEQAALLLFGLVVLPFFYSYNGEIIKRKDPFNEEIINEIIEEHKPQYAVAPESNLWARDIFRNWNKYVSDDRIYLYVNEDLGKYNAGVYLFTPQFNIDSSFCNKNFSGFGRVISTCEQNYYKTLYEYNFNNNSTLDITNEAKIVYNRMSIKIVKF